MPRSFYTDGPNFRSAPDWATQVQPGDLVLVIHYFGFPNTNIPAAVLKKRGAVIVEDASQGLFLRQQFSESICIVYSLRKFLGVPDGAVLVCADRERLGFQLLEPPPHDWWQTALAMTEMRREFDLRGGRNEWFPLFRRVEETFPLGLYRSSDLTRSLVERVDYRFMRNARRKNYAVLLERLGDFALLPVVDEETVPIGFPVRVSPDRRDEVLDHLYGQKIYPPVHWRVEDIVAEEFSATRALSRQILTLICDQRYTASEMARQADAFLSAVG